MRNTSPDSMVYITRDNFDKHWLELEPEPGSKTEGFKTVRLKEADCSRDVVRGPLLSALYDHHIHPDRVAGTLQRLKYKKAAAVLIESFPKGENTRKGNFGEVVASEHLRQRYGYEIPVYKLRYADNPQMPQRGEDLVAFETNEDRTILKLCIGEAKVRSTHDKASILAAHGRLCKAYHPYPIALSLIAAVLHDRGDHDLAEQVDVLIETLAEDRFPRTNWIFVITENQPEDAFEAITEESEIVEDLTCVHLRLERLGDLIDTLFDSLIPEPDADK